ncbi:MAG: DMT family transporter [Thermomicrobiales bacterium]|jgi:small multidrug resistance pump
MGWLWLRLAIVAEIVATTSLRYSNGFSNFVPSLFTAVGYVIAFAMLSQALRTIDYAVWAGVGTAIIAIIGILVFGEPGNIAKTLGITMIIGGVVLVNLQGAH